MTVRNLLALAARNLLRNRWRTGLPAVALAAGVCVMVFLQAFVHGFVEALVRSTVHAKIGAIQVYRAGYLDAEQDLLMLDLPDDAALSARLQAVPGVRAVSPRLDFDGMISNGSISSLFVATAVDPRTEYAVCPGRKHAVAEGSTPLGAEDTRGILVGSALARGLGAPPQSTLMLSATTRAGAANAVDVNVHGLLTDVDPVQQRGVVVPLGLAQELLGMPGRVTQYVLDVVDLARVDAVAANVRAELGPGYDVRTWQDLQALRDAVQRVRLVMLVIGVILALLVASGIINTVMMTVQERVREIGTLLAVGMRRRGVLVLFLAESAVLGVLSASAGALAGWALVQDFSAGIRFPMTGVGGPTIVFPRVDVTLVGGAMALATAVALVAALYPAWKASRLDPVEALRAT